MRPSPAVKVAAVTTALLAVAYVAIVIVLNLLVGAHLTGQGEARLADRLSDARRDPSQLTRPARGPGALISVSWRPTQPRAIEQT